MRKKSKVINKFTRRQMLKLAGVVTGSSLLPIAIASKKKLFKPFSADESSAGEFKSPSTTPFVDELPFPPPPKDDPFTPDPNALSDPTLTDEDKINARFFQFILEEAKVSLHSEMPLTSIWRYRDTTLDPDKAPTLGPTLVVHMGVERKTIFLRHINRLPLNHQGFGIPCGTVHYHGAHCETRSDGFPESVEDGPHPFPAPLVIVPEGGFSGAAPVDGIEPPAGCEPGAPTQYDYRYDMKDPGFSHVGDPNGPVHQPGDERYATQWYHDHLFDFTGPNLVRGLAGLMLVFDELDNGDENDTQVITDGPYKDRTPLRLPSGLGEFDIPLVVQDRRFDQDGQLVYSPGDHDGFLGDKYMVNGKIQPYFRVKRRKYRFRILNGSNARIYQFFLTNAKGDTFRFDHIGNGGGLFAKTIRGVESVLASSATRSDIIFDFSAFKAGDEIFLEDRIVQDLDDGRGPGGKFLDPDLEERGTRVLKFMVEEGDVADPSRVPDVLRPFKAVSELFSQEQIANFPRRTFRFDRRHGAWTVDGEFAELHFEGSVAQPTINKPEIWKFVNKSGGWWHPIHPHSDIMRILTRNGKTPPLNERDGMSGSDAVLLGPNDECEVFLHFRDYPGAWVMHCHTVEHEDMRMMVRFDVVDPKTAVGPLHPNGDSDEG